MYGVKERKNTPPGLETDEGVEAWVRPIPWSWCWKKGQWWSTPPSAIKERREAMVVVACWKRWMTFTGTYLVRTWYPRTCCIGWRVGWTKVRDPRPPLDTSHQGRFNTGGKSRRSRDTLAGFLVIMPSVLKAWYGQGLRYLWPTICLWDPRWIYCDVIPHSWYKFALLRWSLTAYSFQKTGEETRSC